MRVRKARKKQRHVKHVSTQIRWARRLARDVMQQLSRLWVPSRTHSYLQAIPRHQAVAQHLKISSSAWFKLVKLKENHQKTIAFRLYCFDQKACFNSLFIEKKSKHFLRPVFYMVKFWEKAYSKLVKHKKRSITICSSSGMPFQLRFGKRIYQ